MKNLFEKHKTVILYIFFGGLTTLVNLVAFIVLNKIFGFESTVPANTCAWFISVVFAFVTNKLFVFEATEKNSVWFQIISFFAARFLSGVLDILIVFVLADSLNFPELPVKLATNVIVVVLNYIASKLVIFK